MIYEEYNGRKKKKKVNRINAIFFVSHTLIFLSCLGGFRVHHAKKLLSRRHHERVDATHIPVSIKKKIYRKNIKKT